MGTGFVVANDENGSYVLTCNHVLESVEKPKIDDYEIEIIASNEVYDLVLLYVKGLIEKPFTLKEQSNLNEKDVSLTGYRQFTKNKVFRLNTKEAKVLNNGRHKNDNEYFDVWEIKARDDNKILQGYSGSPLIFEGKVIGIMSNRENYDIGFAINIKYLANIWKDMSPNLLLKEKGKNPFVGLKAFTKDEKQFFFGRDKEIEEISDKLDRKGFLAVIGDSGSGKSSIIKAGVIPKYEEQGYYVLPIRPGNNPYEELSHKLNDEIIPTDNTKIIHKLHNYCENKDTKLLFYIDQFEELLTGNETNTKAFLEMLLYISKPKNQRSTLQIDIVYTMRTDYIPFLEKYKDFYALVHNEEYIVRRIKDEPLKEVISKPLVYDNAFTEEEAKQFADFVVEKMGDEPSEITLLQIALTQTWFEHEEGKSLEDAYNKAKGLHGALQNLAEETISRVGEKELLKTIFIRLIHYDENNKHSRRIAESNEFTTTQWELIQKLASALNARGEQATGEHAKFGRLLKLSKVNKKDEQNVELVHEALIRSWDTYKTWINEVSSFKKEHNVVIEKTKDYQIKEASLLTNIELSKALRLLDKDYKDFLSEDEKKYLIESQKSEEEERQKREDMIKDLTSEKTKNQKKIKLLVSLSIILGAFFVLSWYLKIEADRSNAKTFKTLNNSTIGAVLVVEDNNLSAIKYTFNYILHEFNNSSKIKEKRVVIKAWYGKGKLYQIEGNYKKALEIYRQLIYKNNNSNDDEVLRYVAKSLYSQAFLFSKFHRREEAIDKYKFLVETFKNSKDSETLEAVAKAWFNYARYENKSKKQIIYLDLIKFFKNKSDTRILKQVAKTYHALAWFQLIDKSYSKSLELAKKGVTLAPNELPLYVNLAHAYLLRDDGKEINIARKIYLKLRFKRQVIKKDFILFRSKNMTSQYFEDIENMLFFDE